MEKLSLEMDLDDWEFLPDSGFLDISQHEHGGKGKFSKERGFDPIGVIRPFPTSCLTDIPPSQNSSVFSPVSIDLKPMIKKKRDEEVDPELNKVPFIDIPTVDKEVNSIGVVSDQETVSRVFFKKMKENEFIDMKMDSPKANNRGLKLLTEGLKEEPYRTSPEVTGDQGVQKKNQYLDPKSEKDTDWEGCVNLWGWKVNGVGALCCIGVAAATTICILIFGRRGGNKPHHNQKIQFQVQSNEKKSNQVDRQEQFLNQAISAARSVPLSGARILFGDY